MKSIAIAVLLVAIAGCATRGPIGSAAAAAPWASMPSASAAIPSASQPGQDDFMPKLVIPVTGGAPVTAIPLGGNLYQPVTGGPPVPGMPISP